MRPLKTDRRRAIAGVVVACFVGAAPGSAAEDADSAAEVGSAASWDISTAPDTSPYAELRDLEVQMVARALATLERVPVHDPWNQPICAIEVVTYPIFLPEDARPTFLDLSRVGARVVAVTGTLYDALPTTLNALHRTSRERTVRRAITLDIGDLFTTQGYQDAERALRDPFVYSVTAVLPVEAEDPGCVDLLVVTRDVWSLSLSVVPEGENGRLNDLYISAVESNLFGTNDTLSLNFYRGRGSWNIGPTYTSRRFAGSRISVTEQAELIFDREVGGLEGSANYVRVARPLYDSTVPWAWALSAQHSSSIQRLYTGAVLDTYTVGDEEVPDRYRSTFAAARASATRSFGTSVKQNLTFALYFSSREARPVPRVEDLSDDAIATYAAERLPRSERAIGPSLRWSWYENRYFRLANYETFGVSEELRRGHWLSIAVQASEPTIGASARFARLSVGAALRLPLGDDAFAQAGVDHSTRFDAAGASDISLSGSLRLVTARWAAGRFVARASASTIVHNEANTLLELGSGSGLRGYVSGFAKGDRSLVTNVEWRSEPVHVRLARLGMVVFYDGGAMWSQGEAVDFFPSVGLGLRVVIPQFGTRIRVVDIGFPLRGFEYPVVTYGVDQAF